MASHMVAGDLLPVAKLDGLARHEARNVAVDLRTNEHLVADDRPRDWWIANGRDGTRHVQCVGCLDERLDDPWLIYAAGSVQVPHLRHARVDGAIGEPRHSPESSWHLLGKKVVAEWARDQTSVVEAIPETRVAENGVNRRADVLVTCDGGRTAFELQYSNLSADAWAGRHGDYRTAGADSVWLFDMHNRPRLEREMSGSNCFIFDPEQALVGVLLTDPHPRTERWWKLDPIDFTRHIARAGEDYHWILPLPLADFGLDATGSLILPKHPGLEYNLTAVHRAIDQARRLAAARDALVASADPARPDPDRAKRRRSDAGSRHPTLPRSAPRADVLAWCEERFPQGDTQALVEEMSGLISMFEAHGMGLKDTYRAVRTRRLAAFGRSGLPNLPV